MIIKIKNWLEEEIKNNEPIVEGEEELTDGTEDIYVGRSECAYSLLDQLKKWEIDEIREKNDKQIDHEKKVFGGC